MSAKEAKAVIKKTFSIKALEVMFEAEEREGVSAAIEKQIEAIELKRAESSDED